MPDISTVHFDVALTNVSIAHRNTGLIARDIAPEVLVRRQSDKYFIYDSTKEVFRQSVDYRARLPIHREVFRRPTLADATRGHVSSTSAALARFAGEQLFRAARHD